MSKAEVLSVSEGVETADIADASWVDRSAYPFVSRSCRVPGGRLHYVDEGQGETILFSHGTPTWSFEWRHLISGLAGGARFLMEHVSRSRVRSLYFTARRVSAAEL